MKPGRRTFLIGGIVIALLVGGAFVLHSPAAHRIAAQIHGANPHGGLGIHGGGPAAALVGDSGGNPAATVRALATIAAIGRRWDAAAFAETVALYTDIHRQVEWPGVLPAEPVAYGPDVRQMFEVYRPEQGFSEPGPVFVFVHGNGLGTSDRAAPASDGLIYAHLGKLGALAGGIGIVMDYRLRPSTHPTSATAFADGAADVGLAIDWIVAHVADYGGDPGTIVLVANSEGATAAAGYLFDRSLHGSSGPRVAAAMLSSGLFGARAPGIERLVARYDGERVPIALWTAEFDTADVAAGIDAFHAQLCTKYGDCPVSEVLPGHNHVSPLMSLGTSDTSVLNALIRFYHTVR